MNKQLAESIAEKLHDFNPNLNVSVDKANNEVHATIPKLHMGKEDLKTLAEIVDNNTATFDRTGGKLRMVIG